MLICFVLCFNWCILVLFYNIISLPCICLPLNCINSCPLCLALNPCCISSFSLILPASLPPYCLFLFLCSAILLNSAFIKEPVTLTWQGCRCLKVPLQFVGSSAVTSQCFPDIKHTEVSLSQFLLQSVWTQEQYMRCHIFYVLVRSS